MGAALGAVGAAFRAVARRPGVLFLANLIAAALSLPVLGLTWLVAGHFNLPALVLPLVAFVLPSPALAGLQYLTHLMARGESVFFTENWDGLRRFAWPALRVWLLSVLATAVMVANIAYYAGSGAAFAHVLTFIWIYVLAVWLVMHLFLYPLLLSRDGHGLLPLYRDAFVAAVGRPLYSAVATLLWLVILLLCFGTGVAAVIGLALSAAIQQHVTAVLRPVEAPANR